MELSLDSSGIWINQYVYRQFTAFNNFAFNCVNAWHFLVNYQYRNVWFNSCLDSGFNNYWILVSLFRSAHHEHRWWNFESSVEAHLKRKVLLVAAGGVVGSLARWIFSLGQSEDGFPWMTLSVNLIGSIILAWFLVYSETHPSPKWWWRPLFATGFCGGFTTYSAFAVQVDELTRTGQFGTAVLYIVVSLAASYGVIAYVTRKFAP